MNPFDNLLELLQGLISHVPEVLHPVVIALAGAIPFVDGELAGVLGVWAGLHPVLAGGAAAIGNFLIVVVIVLAGGRIRDAVLLRRERRAVSAEVGGGTAGAVGRGAEGAVARGAAASAESPKRARFRRFVVRFGVPGASILGPIALPGHFTSAILVGSGVSKPWILLWQAISIVLWTTLTTAVAAGALSLVAG
jgi:hypothetical protein